MILGVTFETNEQNIFFNLLHWIALPSGKSSVEVLVGHPL
jgi:hypothetical protein